MRRKRLKRHKKEAFQLEINSLLDILVILLVFLIKNYSSSSAELSLPPDLVLPVSMSRAENSLALSVAVDENLNIFIGNKKIGELSKNSTGVIDTLYEHLFSEKTEMDNISKMIRKKSNNVVNILYDKNLPYKYLRRILLTAKEVGLKEFKFVVTQ